MIDLNMFCGNEWHEPYVVSGRRWATDGKLAVIVPAPGEPDTKDGKCAPENCLTPEGTPVMPWPDGPMVRGMAECSDCGGSGLK